MTATYLSPKTPGAYITELQASSSPVVGVATSVPVFVGTTKTGTARQPAAIASLADYIATFGQGASSLYPAMQAFYANGGGNAYVVSAGDLSSLPDTACMLAGLEVAGRQKGATMTVVPQACQLPQPDYAAVAVAMLNQAAALQDRMAILDLPGALDPAGWTPAGVSARADAFYRAIAPAAAALSYGAAYAPALTLPSGGAVPASPVMAGIWAQSDAMHGVWNAPANLTVNGVQGPAAVLTDTGQAPLNVPLNGESVCILRSFPGRGTVVWGARTLDGNSADYRYIQVRRTLIYIEQSIGSALPAYSFAANDATTWAAVTQAIGNFLTGLWQSGGLIGSKPSEAFSVECGVGTTMTAEDVLNGVMRVGVTVQMVHPAEFIELTFTQSMAS